MLSKELYHRLPSLHYGRCGNCNSIIALDARRDNELLDKIYQEMGLEYWDHLSDQTAFIQRLDKYLLKYRNGKCLWDVGCGDGRILAGLDNRWEKHGIEPGVAAVKQAHLSGLDVLQGTASSVGLKSVADVIICIDVIEHLAFPEIELRAMYDMLRSNGVLVLFTGDAGSIYAFLAHTSWQYIRCIGHITIFTKRALLDILKHIGFEIIRWDRMQHQGGVPRYTWWKAFIKNRIKIILQRTPNMLRYYRDHQIVICSKHCK